MIPISEYLYFPTTAAALYTAPAGAPTLLKSLICAETNNAPAQLTLYVVRGGVTAYLLRDFPLPAHGQLTSDTPLVLEHGDALWGVATTAAVALTLCGAC